MDAFACFLGIARRVVGDVLIGAVAALTVDLSVVMPRRIRSVVLRGDYRRIFRHELALCAALMLFALDVRFGFLGKPRLIAARIAGVALRAALAALAALFAFYCHRVVAGGRVDTAGPAAYAIVPGLALEDGAPAKDLLLRLETARRYLEAHPGAALILTGGNPGASGRSEAAVMRGILASEGVPGSRMILEEASESTRANFVNAARMIDPGEPVVLISSDYHMDRAARIAAEAGFARVMRLPAPSDPARYIANMMWEVMLAFHALFCRKRGG